MKAHVYDLEGKAVKEIELPNVFEYPVKEELIRRAVLSEQSFMLQPHGQYILAGMQTTAAYYGRMSSYRSGRHMGIAIRPREKLGGGRQGKVKRIPSAVKGKRAHPQKITKKIVELINKKEYANAIKSAVAATAFSKAGKEYPIVAVDALEGLKKAKEVSNFLESLGISYRNGKKVIRKRSHATVRYKKSALIIVSKDNGIIKAARNLAGVDAVVLDGIKAGLLAPGGHPGRIAIWSESAVAKLPSLFKSNEVKA